MDLTRLPPVGIEHLDVSALLAELTALHAEVRAFTRLKDDVSNLQRAVEKISMENRGVSQQVEPEQRVTNKGDDLQSMANYVLMQSCDNAQQDAGVVSYASHTANLRAQGMTAVKNNVVHRLWLEHRPQTM